MSACEPDGIIKIINAVRKQECLWNVHSKDYGKRDKLENAWHDVAQEVGKADIFCREKWRNVRTGFLRSIQHQIRDGSNQEETPSSTINECNGLKRKRFYLHDQMAFILPSAEALESTRKKRKLNKEQHHKSLVETDDTDGDTSSNNILAEYNLIRKIEPVEVELNEENGENEEFEHHTLMINGEVYSDNDDEEIFKILEHNKNTITQNSKLKDNHRETSSKHKDDNQKDFIAKSNHLTNERTNSVANLKYSPPQFSQREEQQLLDFFRGCIDDILTLTKRKQRLFKKRLLDIIDELHDS